MTKQNNTVSDFRFSCKKHLHTYKGKSKNKQKSFKFVYLP